MALEWLKGILGEGYTDAIDAAISAEIGKSFVPTEELNKQIAKLQEDNKKNKADYEAKISAIRLENAVDSALTAAGAKNNIAAKALLADFLKDAKIAEDGTVNGLSDAVQRLAQNESTAFLFTQNPAPPQLSGMLPGDPGGRAPAPITAGSAADYQSRLDAARKSGDNVAAIAVKTEAAQKGITLF